MNKHRLDGNKSLHTHNRISKTPKSWQITVHGHCRSFVLNDSAYYTVRSIRRACFISETFCFDVRYFGERFVYIGETCHFRSHFTDTAFCQHCSVRLYHCEQLYHIRSFVIYLPRLCDSLCWVERLQKMPRRHLASKKDFDPLSLPRGRWAPRYAPTFGTWYTVHCTFYFTTDSLFVPVIRVSTVGRSTFPLSGACRPIGYGTI